MKRSRELILFTENFSISKMFNYTTTVFSNRSTENPEFDSSLFAAADEVIVICSFRCPSVYDYSITGIYYLVFTLD